MDNNFECVRCGYNTLKKSNILVHLNKKKKCIKRIESFIYNDEEVMTLSLIRKNNKTNLENICKFCNKTYTTKRFLNKHMESYCRLSKKDDNDEDVIDENKKEKEEEKNKIFKTINNNFT